VRLPRFIIIRAQSILNASSRAGGCPAFFIVLIYEPLFIPICWYRKSGQAHSRKVIGWSLDENLDTSLALAALDMALEQRQPDEGALLHHSDRGCQYTSDLYTHAIRARGIELSMSRKGNCHDNAVAESFFATLKKELIYPKTWGTRAEMQQAVFSYIETYYNKKRLHSSLGYRTPAAVESNFHQLKFAA
jgi:putative transposase